MAYVIGVAGAAGAGKSTLVQGLVQSLGDAVPIHIDAYQRITRQPVREIVGWLERGGNYDDFVIPVLGEHLERLKRGEPVVDPVSLRQISAARFVVFETHFGRAHRATGQWIDFLVWIDTPLDVALARNLKDLVRPLVQAEGDPSVVARLARLHEYLESYVADVRRLVLRQLDTVSVEADLRVDGSGAPADMIEQVTRAVRGRFS